jgi:hypothetical protein
MKVSEAAKRVIDLSRKIHDYYEVELPKYYPNYPLVEPEDVEEDKVPSPPEEKELRDFLASLPEETIYQLILIMHLGRYECSTKNLAAHYDSLKELVGNAEQVRFEMMDLKGVLADQLSDGLEELSKHGLNVDKLPLKKLKGRRR